MTQRLPIPMGEVDRADGADFRSCGGTGGVGVEWSER